MTHSNDRNEQDMAFPSRKRAKYTSEERSDEISVTKWEQNPDFSDTFLQGATQATMPPAVFSLLWNFLLEPGDVDAETNDCGLDLQSIASFMLVSRGTKQAFDGCNGWSQCLHAIEHEIHVKDGYIDAFLNQARPLAQKPFRSILSSRDEETCRVLLDKEELLRTMTTRLTHLRNEILPKATRVAGVQLVQDPRVFTCLWDSQRSMVNSMIESFKARREILAAIYLLDQF